MKAISLWQPWASLWCSPRKMHETRHWPTNNRGWILVHAAKRFEKDFDTDFAGMLREEFGATWYRDLPRGAIIGAVELIECRRTEEIYPPDCGGVGDDYISGNFYEGRYAWQRRGFQLFEMPIPYRGAQGFFTVDDALVPEFRRETA